MDMQSRSPKLMDRVKAVMRVKRYSPRTGKTYTLNECKLPPRCVWDALKHSPCDRLTNLNRLFQIKQTLYR
ncbi:hypothetical protein SAMN04487951_10977 [Vreelandella arcis]|uniref:Uncharacterized protein n=1 Tax=Vreelandella arcis TaxID=416873 RepID=A0A1H0F182_9GAMM|nr:hypothetical protein SAMN04487951_10977 [Halomonas arcis]